jgi:hypothetical protein
MPVEIRRTAVFFTPVFRVWYGRNFSFLSWAGEGKVTLRAPRSPSGPAPTAEVLQKAGAGAEVRTALPEADSMESPVPVWTPPPSGRMLQPREPVEGQGEGEAGPVRLTNRPVTMSGKGWGAGRHRVPGSDAGGPAVPPPSAEVVYPSARRLVVHALRARRPPSGAGGRWKRKTRSIPWKSTGSPVFSADGGIRRKQAVVPKAGSIYVG